MKYDTRPQKLPDIISIEEFNELLKVTKKPHHRLAFKLGFLCGLRISEVIKLKPDDVDPNRKMLFIQDAKGGKDRYVPFPSALSRDLKFLPFKIGKRAIQKAISLLSEKALKNKIHFHTLRHSAATYYIHKGMDVRYVQQLLGHSNLNTTQIYTHISPDNLQNKMDEIWK